MKLSYVRLKCALTNDRFVDARVVYRGRSDRTAPLPDGGVYISSQALMVSLEIELPQCVDIVPRAFCLTIIGIPELGTECFGVVNNVTKEKNCTRATIDVEVEAPVRRAIYSPGYSVVF